MEKEIKTPQEILKEYFGYDDFRDGQEPLIDALLHQRDVFGIMPTGAGKSLCYQIPALAMEGITLVISPLISLMKDQVEALNQAGIKSAYLNSSLTTSQYNTAIHYAEKGLYKIIYVAPERLEQQSFLAFAQKTRLALIAVDEAHCVSQWGQDFRPGYLKIPAFINALPSRPVVGAFTATATKAVKEDIQKMLQLDHPLTLTTGFDRQNLYFATEHPVNKATALLRFVKEHKQESGIIYCSTRKNVENVTEELAAKGYTVTRYHAGLSDTERRKNQENFIYDKIPIMVATNAFGMGIDKSNVRFVLHYNMPKNIESYYQEAGRAGRDGGEAHCLLFYSGQDVRTNQFFIDKNKENDELSAAEKEQIRHRDMLRLQKMEAYAKTKDCLRHFMLAYFGEDSPLDCKKCSNCLGEFTTLDISNDAALILGLLSHNDWDYGAVTIAEALHGSKNAKVRQARLDQNPYYAKMSNVKLTDIRDCIDTLVAENYLLISTGNFSVLQITEKGFDFLKNGGKITRSVAVKKTEAASRLKGTKMLVSSEEKPLFDALRQKRRTIAEAENVPPYIVFSDKTLKEMSAKRPQDEEEMLAVSGVGEVKFRRYGQDFLDVIKHYEPKDTIEPKESFHKILDVSEKGLLEALRTLAKEIAEENDMAAFQVFSDKTLREISRYCPETEEELLEIKGIGEEKLDYFGERLLEVIKEWIAKE